MKLRVKSSYLLCLAGLLMAFTTVRSAVVFFARQQQPYLEVDAPAADIGRVPTSQPVQHRFRLTNVGNPELLILETKSGCDCVVAQLPRKVLQAGQSMPLDVTFTPKKVGSRQHRILIETNDPQHPVTVLTLKATAYDPVVPEARP